MFNVADDKSVISPLSSPCRWFVLFLWNPLGYCFWLWSSEIFLCYVQVLALFFNSFSITLLLIFFHFSSSLFLGLQLDVEQWTSWKFNSYIFLFFSVLKDIFRFVFQAFIDSGCICVCVSHALSSVIILLRTFSTYVINAMFSQLS